MSKAKALRKKSKKSCTICDKRLWYVWNPERDEYEKHWITGQIGAYCWPGEGCNT